jgi:uncharacterized protein (DUF1015 family)
MATIKSFRGTRYNPQRIGELSSIISQPYDRVRHGLQDKYYERSPYNVVRIIRGKETPEDDEQDNVYTRAGKYYEAWLGEGILKREDTPALYVLRQSFTLPDGMEKTRQGLIAALELVPFDEGTVLPHERTHSGPKVDRLKLMRATEVNFGHIFMLYPGDRINELLNEAVERAEGFEARELFERDVLQQFWPVTDAETIAAVREEMAPKRNLIITATRRRSTTGTRCGRPIPMPRPTPPSTTAWSPSSACRIRAWSSCPPIV